jgi:hypothetical protein
MHTHQSLWKQGTPLMADKSGYAGLSQLGRAYVGGLLAHAPALLAFCAPTTNSYRRLVPGFEAPVNLVYSQRNRSACIRIPMYSESAKAKRIEFRPPDAAANPYLAFSAMLMAGLDGIERDLDPGAPADFDLFEHAGADVPQVPGSLAEALDALEADHEFLLRGGVFSEELIETWIAWKRRNEVDVVRLRPHPGEARSGRASPSSRVNHCGTQRLLLRGRSPCRDGDTRNATRANDAALGRSYARLMTNRAGQEHAIKRTADRRRLCAQPAERLTTAASRDPLTRSRRR